MSDNKSTLNVTSRVFTVEVRLSQHAMPPRDEHGMLLDGEWRQVHFHQSPIGVPSGLLRPEPTERGYLSEDSAMALAWWFLASCESLGVETRLVEHEFCYRETVERLGEREPQRSVWRVQRDMLNAVASRGQEPAP